jgi:hypothetical protein
MERRRPAAVGLTAVVSAMAARGTRAQQKKVVRGTRTLHPGYISHFRRTHCSAY